jgi:hypothetical protein
VTDLRKCVVMRQRQNVLLDMGASRSAVPAHVTLSVTRVKAGSRILIVQSARCIALTS